MYGVAGEIQVSVTKAGYTPLVQTLMVAQETLADFEITQTTSQSIAGTYSMTIDASGGCKYGAGLPDDLKRRTYAATITQTGPAFRVELSGANFIEKNGLGHGFPGRVQPGLISFDIGDGYYTPYPDIIESLGGNQRVRDHGQRNDEPVRHRLGRPAEWRARHGHAAGVVELLLVQWLVRLAGDSCRTDESGRVREEDSPMITWSRPGLEAPLRPTAGLRMPRRGPARATTSARARPPLPQASS